MTRLDSSATEFNRQLESLLSWDAATDLEIHQRVLEIITNIRKHGDQALLDYTNLFDLCKFKQPAEMELSQAALLHAWNNLPSQQAIALQTAANRIRAYAEHQKLQPWEYTEIDGNVLGQKITALDKAGLYARRKSCISVLSIDECNSGQSSRGWRASDGGSDPNGETNPLVLAAAHIAGVDRIFTIGGAQAIAALAYGTETIPAVDKIVGPGNIYVATAKKLVFGQVGIDMIAGPSEILIICDGDTDPDWIAMDLFSQAEHDENAQAILISNNADFLHAVERSINKLLPDMERAETIAASLQARGAFILVSNLLQAAEIANRIAPEHLELSVADPEVLNVHIRNAGAVFLGRYTAEALGDYCAGPNHVLPTSGTARYSSPLGVYDFQKRSSLINCSAAGARQLGKIASVLARGESLTAHARSAEYRL